MPTTYTYAEPAAGVFTDPKDEVRFLLSDTTPAAPFSLTDDEIEYLLAQTATTGAAARLAASRAARRMATRYGKQSATMKSVGDLRISYLHSESATRYEQLADELLRDTEAGMTGGMSGFGGYYEPGTTPNIFGQGDFDNPVGAINNDERNKEGYL